MQLQMKILEMESGMDNITLHLALLCMYFVLTQYVRQASSIRTHLGVMELGCMISLGRVCPFCLKYSHSRDLFWQYFRQPGHLLRTYIGPFRSSVDGNCKMRFEDDQEQIAFALVRLAAYCVVI